MSDDFDVETELRIRAETCFANQDAMLEEANFHQQKVDEYNALADEAASRGFAYEAAADALAGKAV